MNEIRTLTRLELYALFGVNRFRHTREKGEKKRYRFLSGVWAFLAVLVGGYVGGLVFGLCELGLAAIVPTYLVTVASLLILFFGLFSAGNTVFGPRGYELLASMPLRAVSIVISRFLVLYIEDLLLTLAILVPGLAVYGILQAPPISFYAVAAVGGLLLPVIPLVISTLLGTLIAAVTARMKHKSLVATALSVALVLAILMGSFGMQDLSAGITLEMLADLAGSIGTLLGHLYPPAVWLGNAMLGTAPLDLLWSVLVSVGALALCLLLATRFFHRILRGLSHVTAKHDYKLGRMAHRGLGKALYLREARRYFASSIYVTNTIIGPILGCVMCVSLCVTGLDTVTGALPPSVPVIDLLPFVVAAVFGMMTTTCSSVSMEGREFWIIRTLPVPVGAWLGAKMLLNLSLIAPFYLIGEVFLMIAVRPGPMDAIFLLLIPACLILFAVVFGITVNLRFCRFDWEKETEVVKQGIAPLLGGLVPGLLLSLICGGAVLITPALARPWIKAGICLLLLIGAWLLQRRNRRVRIEEL